MRGHATRLGLSLAVVIAVGLACDPNKEMDLGMTKTRDLKDLKQAAPKASPEELEEARRRAGFKSPEEQRAEAVAEYTKRENAYIKGRIDGFKGLTKDLRAMLGMIEKNAPKWAKAKSADKAIERFKKAYDKKKKAWEDDFDEVTEKGTRGGDVVAELNRAAGPWEDLNASFSGDLAEAEGFAETLEGIRKQLDKVDEMIKAVEDDDSIEPETPDE